MYEGRVGPVLLSFMSFSGFLLTLIAIWCIIHVCYRLGKRQDALLLPTLVNTAGRRSFLGAPHHTNVFLNTLHLRVSTTRWNARHDQRIAFFAKRENSTTIELFQGVYNFGVVFGAVGMITAIILCLSSFWFVSKEWLYAGGSVDTAGPTSTLLKRMTKGDTSTLTPTSFSQFPAVKPIIPGLTVPLTHLPIILFGVFISQVVHELGHAIAAAIESLPMLSAGASFTICLPAAFVSFSTAAMTNLNRQARSRVIAAGPFHNLMFWCCLMLLVQLGFANVMAFVSGYENVSSIGKVVVDVSTDSPLFSYLSSGSIISQLDDVSLSSSSNSHDIWATYLTSPRRQPFLGWCIGTTSFRETSHCCSVPSVPEQSFSCFTSVDNPSDRGCVDPVPILTNPTKHERCANSKWCGSESTCAVPHQEVQLMRLQVQSPVATNHSTVLLWSGSKQEVFEDVRVSNWFPRLRFLPLWMPLLLQTFWNYLCTVTLSLYFFNLLPLPYLDGTELLAVFIESVVAAKQVMFTYDVESQGGRTNTRGSTQPCEWWMGWIVTMVQYSLLGILILYVFLASMNALR